MKILICGSRDLPVTEKDIRSSIHGAVMFPYSLDLIICGDCPTGADKAALIFARNNFIDVSCHVAGWEKHGKAAGPIRNQAMIDMEPDVVIAFWDGQSRGTLDTIRRAAAAGIRVVIPEACGPAGGAALAL